MDKYELFQLLLNHLSITKSFSCYLHDGWVTEGLSGNVHCCPQLWNGFFTKSSLLVSLKQAMVKLLPSHT